MLREPSSLFVPTCLSYGVVEETRRDKTRAPKTSGADLFQVWRKINLTELDISGKGRVDLKTNNPASHRWKYPT